MPGQLKKTKLASDTGGIDVDDELVAQPTRWSPIVIWVFVGRSYISNPDIKEI